MAGPDFKVTVQPIKTVSVKIGQETTPKAVAIAYGVSRTLTSLTDVNAENVINNQVLTYSAQTNNFVFKSVVDTNLNIDNGFF